MAMYAILFVVFLAFGCNAEDCDFTCLSESKFTVYGLSFDCPGGQVCNSNCQEVSGARPICAPVSTLCPYTCSSPADSTIKIGPPGNEIVTECPKNMICNGALDSCKNMCIPDTCPNANVYKCLDDFTYEIYGILGTCGAGTVCNKKKEYPCNICTKSEVSETTTPAQSTETTIIQDTTKLAETTKTQETTKPQETTQSEETTTPSATTTTKVEEPTEPVETTKAVETTQSQETTTPEVVPSEKTTKIDEDTTIAKETTKPVETTTPEVSTKPNESTVPVDTTTPEEITETPEPTTITTTSTTTAKPTESSVPDCNNPSGSVSPCRYGPKGFYYKCIRKNRNTYVPKLMSCYKWKYDIVCRRYRLCE